MSMISRSQLSAYLLINTSSRLSRTNRGNISSYHDPFELCTEDFIIETYFKRQVHDQLVTHGCLSHYESRNCRQKNSHISDVSKSIELFVFK